MKACERNGTSASKSCRTVSVKCVRLCSMSWHDWKRPAHGIISSIKLECSLIRDWTVSLPFRWCVELCVTFCGKFVFCGMSFLWHHASHSIGAEKRNAVLFVKTDNMKSHCYTFLSITVVVLCPNTETQVQLLIDEFHVYLLKTGRISMCGLNENNVAHVAKAIHTAVTTISH